ncbi:very-long-chain 3-oxoacyl-CoA reductase-like [Sturnira hondurensis]|uniref:very-long-chain 3-oxoacyl-CoA reductase-like n=1 Tax=Sturnira hondurensis TaxID=192404 RepID=UPI00187A9EAB|nr:very-long-chain 3-oxoacyl-CoA reductase-like [Sturnira hondurensis]
MSVAQMTAIVLPQMVSRSKGIIVNISSILGEKPNPLFSAYSASKTVNPVLVESSMTANIKYRMSLMNSEDYARQALDTLGLTSRTPGCLSHAVQVPPWGNYGRRAG